MLTPLGSFAVIIVNFLQLVEAVISYPEFSQLRYFSPTLRLGYRPFTFLHVTYFLRLTLSHLLSLIYSEVSCSTYCIRYCPITVKLRLVTHAPYTFGTFSPVSPISLSMNYQFIR